MQRFAPLFAAAVLAATATAQFNIVIPAGMATAEGSTSNAFPWGRGGGGIRIQTVYDSSHFTTQGVTFPVLITGLRWRPNTNASSLASNYATGATVMLSTCQLDQGAVSTTMASNQGPDLTTVFNGPVSWPAAAATPGPCPFLIDIPFTTNFLYDPNSGDLNIETDIPIQTFTGTALQLDVHGTAPLASRTYITTGYPGTGVGTTNLNHGVVVEVLYTPASGLYAGFTANATSGASPLAVQFTSTTFTSDPGGVLTYAWDLDGDSVIDSNLQNPSFVYQNCGTYNVSLTVTDATHPPSTLTRTGYISTDNVTPSFTFAQIAPGVVQFTDTSTPVPTSWAWDLNGDNVVDSNAQNPVFAYPGICTATTVTLTVNRLCRGPFSSSRSLVLSPAEQTTLVTGGNGLSAVGSGNTFDVTVHNPAGISICSISMAPYMATPLIGTPLGCTVWITDAAGGFLANHTNAAVWRQVATGTGTFAGGTFTAPVLVPMTLSNPIYLPAGTYGMAIHMTTGSGVAYTTLTATTTYAGPDVSISCGNGKGSPFAASANANRAWNGRLHYSTLATSNTAGYGFFGAGCPSSLGITNLTATAPPLVGSTLTVNMNNLPQSAVFMTTGYSRTAWAQGALPADLTVYGMPGCFGRVSPDAVLFLAGANNAAQWTFAIINDPVFIGLQMYNQAFVLDPLAGNPLGAVASDAAAMLIGN